MRHVLPATRQSLHGVWSRDLPPALTIDAGDSVVFECLDAMWNVRPPVDGMWQRFEPSDPRLDCGHALTGPVFVRGTRPGMMLRIDIGAMDMGDWGWTWSWPRGWDARVLGVEGMEDHVQTWRIDSARRIASDDAGRRLRLRPFMGVMGVCPEGPGVHMTTPPRIWGGNIDCRELVTGTTLFLPVGVEGALFSTGDGHALQGDGEVCGTALECPMRSVEMTFGLCEDPPIRTPYARTPGGWITFGFDASLNRATQKALTAMLDLMQQHLKLPRSEVLALASLTTDLRITQIVNQERGVHCVWDEKSLEAD